MKHLFTLLMTFISCTAFSQSWETIKNSKEYLYGEGWGMSINEADKQAIENLISKIALQVEAETKTRDTSKSRNGEVYEESQFSQSVKTYSQATLTNTQNIIVSNEPDAHVVRWILKSELQKIFNSRINKAKDMAETGLRAEDKGKADDALRNYYWALSLLKTLQYPSEVKFAHEGKEYVMTTWLKERMDEVFDDLKARAVRKNGDDVELYITYKGKPVNSVDYTYFDGRSWSNIYSAKDGRGVLELAPGNSSTTYRLKYEFEYLGESQIDREIAMALANVKGTPMRSASADVAGAQQTGQASDKLSLRAFTASSGDSFTSNTAAAIAAPSTIKTGQTEYVNIMQGVIKGIKARDNSARASFSDDGWQMYEKLIHYGTAKLVGEPTVAFYPNGEYISCRGLQMAFSFKTGMRKSFVEDVVFLFDKNKKIVNVAFGLGKTSEDDILYKGAWSESARMAIMNFLENYKTAYALKRADYIESIFDDNAVIITATVKHQAEARQGDNMTMSNNKIIKYNRQTKDQYLKNLRRCFDQNEFVNIRFANNDVYKLGKGGELYAIQISQDYYSSSYGDKGYLFLMVDINNPEKPIIKVRTWQPEKDPNFGLYGPGDF